MTQQQQQQEHLPLDTHLIRWPTLGDILDELMLSIEQRPGTRTTMEWTPNSSKKSGTGNWSPATPP